MFQPQINYAGLTEPNMLSVKAQSSEVIIFPIIQSHLLVLLCLRACHSHGRPILVIVISQEYLERISSNVAQSFTSLKNELIRF